MKPNSLSDELLLELLGKLLRNTIIHYFFLGQLCEAGTPEMVQFLLDNYPQIDVNAIPPLYRNHKVW